MNDIRKIVDSTLEMHGSAWSEADRALLAHLVESAAAWSVSAGLGVDVTAELAQLKSQAASVTAAEAWVVQSIFRTALTDVLIRGVSIVAGALA